MTVSADTEREADRIPEGSESPATSEGFSVKVGDFEGPFDLLLSLISKHKLEVTDLALHQVTDEFIAYIKGKGGEWDLDEASGFLVVAATLLDLKAARLLPSGEVEDEEDLALLEARDLLFARLLQYRAYKEVAALIANQMETASKRLPRTVSLEPQFAALLPEVLIGIGLDQFAALAAAALAPKTPEQVGLGHLHVPKVSVREQAAVIVQRLRRTRTSTFRALVADAESTLVVVGRFLALLELYREHVVLFEQVVPLGDLTIRWVGSEDGDVEVTDEFDVEREVDQESVDQESGQPTDEHAMNEQIGGDQVSESSDEGELP